MALNITTGVGTNLSIKLTTTPFAANTSANQRPALSDRKRRA
ncbi:Uncharacterised protein [Vibrio cholerae]|nr:Uncharacterised protein [Vibrio cholerae]